jgi:hypothetical protein
MMAIQVVDDVADQRRQFVNGPANSLNVCPSVLPSSRAHRPSSFFFAINSSHLQVSPLNWAYCQCLQVDHFQFPKEIEVANSSLQLSFSSSSWTTSRKNSASGERRVTGRVTRGLGRVTRGLGKFGYANSLNFQNGLETDALEY